MNLMNDKHILKSDKLRNMVKWKIYLHYLILFALIYLLIFLKLDSFHMRWWDESMFAVNTYEMLQNGKWFSLYFDNVPDIFNTKPPLTSWLQILFVKIAGYNEIALRLPSAIAAGLTVILLFKFAVKHFNFLWAWIIALILLTSSGFIDFHTALTADADSLLTLFVLIANLYFIRFILFQAKRDIFFYFVFITLAFAVKLYAALLFIPAYIFILIYKRLFKQFTISWPFLFGLLFFILVIGSLLYLRELDAPGYLREVIFKDAGRITTVIEDHRQPKFFYTDNLFRSRYSIWFIFFVIGAVLILFHTKKNEKIILLTFLIFIIAYLTIIMISITKLEWYDMPLFPYLSVIASYPIYLLIQNLKFREKPVSSFMQYILLIMFFIYPCRMMFNKSPEDTIYREEKILEGNDIYIYNKIKNNENLNDLKVYHNNWKGSLLFYKYKLAEKNERIELINNVSQVSVNDKILVCDDRLKSILLNRFELTVIDSLNNAKLFYIEDKKQTVSKTTLSVKTWQ